MISIESLKAITALSEQINKIENLLQRADENESDGTPAWLSLTAISAVPHYGGRIDIPLHTIRLTSNARAALVALLQQLRDDASDQVRVYGLTVADLPQGDDGDE